MSVELYASMANRKITSDATTTPRPMYIHHMGHLEFVLAAGLGKSEILYQNNLPRA
jgi:hypothetical protein